MVTFELKLPESTNTTSQQAATQAQKSEAEVALPATWAYLDQLADIDPLLGLFAGDTQLIDQVETDAMQARERAVLHLY